MASRIIDDFTTGHYDVPIPAAPNGVRGPSIPASGSAVQSGSMLGGSRAVTIVGPQGERGEPSHFAIAKPPAAANRCNLSLGSQCVVILQISYGFQTPIGDLSKYTAIRVNFASSSAVNVNLNIYIDTPVASSGEEWAQGSNVPPGVFNGAFPAPWTPFFAEYPLFATENVPPQGSVGTSADYGFQSKKYPNRFATPADLTEVTTMEFQLQVYEGSVSLDSFELV